MTISYSEKAVRQCFCNDICFGRSFSALLVFRKEYKLPAKERPPWSIQDVDLARILQDFADFS